MNLPNILTLSRVFLIGIMMALLGLTIPFAKSMALGVFVIAGFTDYLDGHIARTRNCITAFGKLMDPLTDKIMVCAAFVSFVEIQLNIPSKGYVSVVPAWIVVIIIGREFLVTGLRLLAANRGNIISAGKWGKHKTVWQIVAIVIILLGWRSGTTCCGELIRN
jgi:CDP-diacylglycerol--glycerol-3-phosphate 3-phosphatidyltransferase